MKRFSLITVALLSLGLPALGQNTDYNGRRSDPNQVRTYRADVGIVTINIVAPGVSNQASSVIMKANTACEIIVQVQSNSDLILEGYRLNVTVDGQPVGSLKQDGLRPHEAVTHHIRYAGAARPGPHEVQAIILPVPLSFMPGEDNPNNNSVGMSFTVEGGGGTGGGLADLVVDHITPSEAMATDKVILEIGVGNQGDTDVTRPVELDVVIAGSSRRVRTTTGVPAGKTAFASIELSSDVWKRNPHGRVTVDPGNEVKETNKANNTKTF